MGGAYRNLWYRDGRPLVRNTTDMNIAVPNNSFAVSTSFLSPVFTNFFLVKLISLPPSPAQCCWKAVMNVSVVALSVQLLYYYY